MSADASDDRVPVAVLGATGIVGQHLVQRLDGHPTLRLAEVVGSPSRAASVLETVLAEAGGIIHLANSTDTRIE